MRHWQVEDLNQKVESVQTVHSGIARTLQIIANGDFEFNRFRQLNLLFLQ